MQTKTLRMLACAFAAADFLFEIDSAHRVDFAAGAGSGVAGLDAAEARGSDWRLWIAEADRDMAEALCSGLAPGERRGPAMVRLALGAGDRFASLTAFCLPSLHPAVSCALALGGSLTMEAQGVNGLHDAAGFEAVVSRLAEAAQRDGVAVDLSLLELTPAAASQPEAVKKLAGLLRAHSYGGRSAACVSANRYALLRPRGAPGQLEAAVASTTGLEATVVDLPLNPAWGTEVFLRTLRFTLDQFIKEGLGDDPAKTLAEFETRAASTDAKAKAFIRRVEKRDFKLAYQPVVSLRTGVIDHYEVLARFSDSESPAELILFAEELDLMEPFDLAITQSSLAALNAPGNRALKVAVNLSARSVLSETFIDHLLVLVQRPGLTERLEFEITESADLGDLGKANHQIQRLRQQGFKVALDDFGAGSASFAYLKSLQVDCVKIDGQYVRGLADSTRDAALVRHLAQLCRDLGVVTIAEMVETSEVADLLRSFGVDLAQGFLYGKPAAKPEPLKPRMAPRLRRAGAVDGWG